MISTQSVRRKGGKYVYIICSKNPKHKQRYVALYIYHVISADGGTDFVIGRDRGMHGSKHLRWGLA